MAFAPVFLQGSYRKVGRRTNSAIRTKILEKWNGQVPLFVTVPSNQLYAWGWAERRLSGCPPHSTQDLGSQAIPSDAALWFNGGGRFHMSHVRDVLRDLDPPRLQIHKAKFHKSRLVPIHQTVADQLRQYIELRRV